MQPTKGLYRTRSGRILGGVCAGLAEYFGLNPCILRLFFVFFTLFVGFGLLLYIILWIVMPLESIERSRLSPKEKCPHALYRSRQNKVLAGVCGGLGQALGIDPVVVRIGFIVAVFFAGSALLVYLLLWLIMPQEPYPA